MDRQKLHRVPPVMTGRARRLRQDATFPERLLWSRLRDRRLGDLRFRRQFVIGSYVADFFCPEKNLVIEIDGRSHDYHASQDEERERFFLTRGYCVIRFTNDEVVENVDGALAAICGACDVRT